jgi:hypothetical protein
MSFLQRFSPKSVRKSISVYLVNKSVESHLLRVLLHRRPHFLGREDYSTFAVILIERGDKYLLPAFIGRLDSLDWSIAEGPLWRIAQSHIGGRTWLTFLEKVADKTVWTKDEWRDYAVLCGSAGLMTREIAQSAGLDHYCGTWWSPRSRVINVDQSGSVVRNLDEGKIARENTKYQDADFEELMAHFRNARSLGWSDVTDQDKSDLAIAFHEQGFSFLIMQLISEGAPMVDWAVLSDSKRLGRLRYLMRQSYEDWLRNSFKNWTRHESAEEAVKLLLSLDETFDTPTLKTLVLKKSVLNRLMKKRHKGSVYYGREDLTQALQAVYRRVRIEQKLKHCELVSNHLT